jgi:hypothetical protein
MVEILLLRMLRASRSKTWVIYHLIESFRCCIWYHAFLLDPLKFDGIASSHFCIAPYHMHNLTSVFITMSKSVSMWCNLECILYNLVVIECFRWPLLDVTPWTLFRTSSIGFTLCVSCPVRYLGAPCCGANSPCFSHAQMLSCKLTVIVRGPLGYPLLSVINPCRERNQSLGWWTFTWLLSPCNWSHTHWVKLV